MASSPARLLADFLKEAQGGIAYLNGTPDLTVLAAGTDRQFLQTQGAAANPQWAASPDWTESGAIDLTSGSPTAVELFSGAATAREFYIYLDDVSTSAANTAPIIQLGTGAGPTFATTGYDARGITGANGGQDDTDGCYPGLETLFDAATVAHIQVRGLHLGSNVWAMWATAIRNGATGIDHGQAIVTLGAALTAAQLTTSVGTATFDGGTGYALWY
jgi:hypothetical protein